MPNAIELQNITKAFPGVLANDHVNITVEEAEIDENAVPWTPDFQPVFEDAEEAGEELEASAATVWAAGVSPVTGTWTFCPSLRTAARLMVLVSASALSPPAASTASRTLGELPSSSKTPGLDTAPSTCTMTLFWAAAWFVSPPESSSLPEPPSA